MPRPAGCRPLQPRNRAARVDRPSPGGLSLGRGVEAVWLRLARAARSHGAALLVGSPYRVSGTAASVVIKAERARISTSSS